MTEAFVGLGLGVILGCLLMVSVQGFNVFVESIHLCFSARTSKSETPDNNAEV